MNIAGALVDYFLYRVLPTGALVHWCIYTHTRAPLDLCFLASAMHPRALVHAPLKIDTPMTTIKTEIQTDKESDLIAAFARHGVAISQPNVPVILAKGADWYLAQKGITVSENEMLEIYLIMTEMKGV